MSKPFITVLREAYRFPLNEETVVKAVVKDWLDQYDLPDYGSPNSIRRLLMAAVDEPYCAPWGRK